jgi:hypothetical protein
MNSELAKTTKAMRLSVRVMSLTFPAPDDRHAPS